MAIFIVVLAFITSVATGTLVGYGVHWIMHQPWSRALYRSHMQHHMVHYPATNLYSAGHYRSSGLSSGWLTFTPFVLAAAVGIVLLLHRLLHASWEVEAAVLVAFAFIGGAHGVVHDAFHVSDHWLGRFGWFRQLRALHEPHHHDMSKNLGILWFGWDRVFRSFRR
jgi:hypothetical protein